MREPRPKILSPIYVSAIETCSNCGMTLVFELNHKRKVKVKDLGSLYLCVPSLHLSHTQGWF